MNCIIKGIKFISNVNYLKILNIINSILEVNILSIFTNFYFVGYDGAPRRSCFILETQEDQ